MREQLNELKKAAKPAAPPAAASAAAGGATTMMDSSMMASPAPSDKAPAAEKAEKTEKDEETPKLIARIERRLGEQVNTPASPSIANLVIVEVAMDADAKPGPRELRLATPRGVSNPLVFYVGQLPELCRKPMLTAQLQVLGKEELALRKRPESEVEDRVTVPCTLNGQIASGEVNRYRFEAREGQRLVISTSARQLIPFIADAVPGWFQPVLRLYDADGKEVAYDDDYRFNPDPVIFYNVPERRPVRALRSTTPSIAGGRISSIASPSANCRSSRASFPWAAARASRQTSP